MNNPNLSASTTYGVPPPLQSDAPQNTRAPLLAQSSALPPLTANVIAAQPRTHHTPTKHFFIATVSRLEARQQAASPELPQQLVGLPELGPVARLHQRGDSRMLLQAGVHVHRHKRRVGRVGGESEATKIKSPRRRETEDGISARFPNKSTQKDITHHGHFHHRGEAISYNRRAEGEANGAKVTLKYRIRSSQN